MDADDAAPYRSRLIEKLADSLSAPLPELTPRRVYGAVSLPGKATAVIGMRRAGKTTFLHQLRRERLARGVAWERLVYVNFEDEQLAGLTAEHLRVLPEEYYRRFPDLRGRETVTWCLDEIQVVPGWERFVRRVLDSEAVELFLSGSSAALLSREIATAMRGGHGKWSSIPSASRSTYATTGSGCRSAPGSWRRPNDRPSSGRCSTTLPSAASPKSRTWTRRRAGACCATTSTWRFCAT